MLQAVPRVPRHTAGCLIAAPSSLSEAERNQKWGLIKYHPGFMQLSLPIININEHRAVAQCSRTAKQAKMLILGSVRWAECDIKSLRFGIFLAFIS